MADLAHRLGRRIGVLVDRAGEVRTVVVGDAHRVFLPDLGPRRAGAQRFRGVRLVLAGPRADLVGEDELTDLALLQLDAVVAIRALPDGSPGELEWAWNLPPDEGAPWAREHLPGIWAWKGDVGAFIRELEGRFARSPALRRVDNAERAILIGVSVGDASATARRLIELRRLADTAGLTVVDEAVQVRRALDPRTCIGQGKLAELVLRSMHLGVHVLVFDRELSPSQLRNVATTTELKVLDRTQLILDIFARRATTREGRNQVELAQLRYRMPRLAIMPTAMSRLTGGIGGRGPGETKLEINRRRAQQRADRLEREGRERAKGRAVRRARRTRAGLPIVSLVGYTNAGKSSLLNLLTRSGTLVEDRLFATLDTTTRRLRFPEDREILVTDTIGFIEHLPATLVSAFKGTLEELDESDLLVHVLDAADDAVEEHLTAVTTILGELGLSATPRITVWNKVDLAPPDRVAELRHQHGGVAASATTGRGAADVLDAVERALFRNRMATA